MSATSVQFSVAVHMMAALGFHEGEGIRSSRLASSVKADPSFIRKSLSKLVKSGLVVATRGKNGSCTLARKSELITLLDIYRASEAPPTFAVHSYPVEERCPTSVQIKPCLHHLLDVVQDSFEQSLAQITLAQVVADIREKSV